MVGPPLFREPGLNLGTSARALNKGEPVSTWPTGFALIEHYFNDISVIQYSLEGNQSAVDLGSRAFITHIGMY